jgi:malic enzyme
MSVVTDGSRILGLGENLQIKKKEETTESQKQ